MELTDRERRILAELEGQFATGKPAQRTRRGRRPQWTVVPSAVLGCLLFAAGIALGVGSAVLMGTLLLVWWLFPWLWRLLSVVGRSLLESFANMPPGTIH